MWRQVPNLKLVPGAKVTFTDRRNSRAATVKVLTTGNNGEVRIPFNSAKYRIEKTDSCFMATVTVMGIPATMSTRPYMQLRF